MVLTQPIVYKNIEDLKEIEDVVFFQEEIWGRDAVTPLPQLIAAAHHGGILIGAFDERELIGFSYGFSGYKNGENYLISHMTGVRRKYQNYGIGLQLKLKQRDWAVDYGYQKIVWTFDPLEARNAYFNFNKLGAYAKTYYPSYYGEMSDKLNKGLPTDRLLAEWDICSNRVQNALTGVFQNDIAAQNYQPLLVWSDVKNVPYPLEEEPIKNEKGYLIPVPVNFQSLKLEDYEAAKAWRYKLRNAVSNAISEGFAVTGILKNNKTNVHFYVIEKKTMEALHD
jgi:predicted GNAT superfamily acetyltransferase